MYARLIFDDTELSHYLRSSSWDFFRNFRLLKPLLSGFKHKVASTSESEWKCLPSTLQLGRKPCASKANPRHSQRDLPCESCECKVNNVKQKVSFCMALGVVAALAS